MISRGVRIAVTAAALLWQDVPPRSLGAPIARFEGDLSAISGARELADGRVLVTDFREPAIHVVDLRTGASTRVGRSGSGPNEYQQPGGIFAGRADTSIILDRSQARILLVARDGRIAGMRSVAVQGTSGSSAEDVDRTRIDATGTPYFLDPSSMFAGLRGRTADSVALWRFDPARQRADTVAKLRLPETRILSAEGNVVRTQRVLFSPADGWAVAPDGRVAVVRAVPYRVEWIGRDGNALHGPEIGYTAVRVSDEDRQVVTSQSGSAGVSGLGGGRQMTARTPPVFAATKPAFDPNDIIVAPNGHLWVGRMVPANATHVVYDVFNERGSRIDRIRFPARSRVVGFGPGAVFVNERDQDDLPHLRKYALASAGRGP